MLRNKGLSNALFFEFISADNLLKRCDIIVIWSKISLEQADIFCLTVSKYLFYNDLSRFSVCHLVTIIITNFMFVLLNFR